MRVLIVTQNFPPLEGGISTHCYEMARNWGRSEEVWVLAPHASAADGDHPFPGRLVRMPRAGNQVSRLLVSLVSTLRLTRRIRPDLIYGTHWRNCGVALRLVASFTKVPFFLAVHGSEVFDLLKPHRKLYLALFRWVAAGCRGFVALGQYQQHILRKLRIENERVFTSPEGIDLTRLATAEGDGSNLIRARHHLEGKAVIVTVGRLVERKGHDMIIRALPQVLNRVREAVYLIVGRGPMEKRLRALAREMGVQDRVLFCGFVPEKDLMAYYQAADVFAMPNREVEGDTEGFGIVFVEAGACGKPVVGGLSGGAVEVIADGVTGFLVNPVSVEEIAQTLTTLLEDRGLASRMGRAGRARVEQHYTYQQVAQNIAVFLRQVVDKSGVRWMGSVPVQPPERKESHPGNKVSRSSHNLT
jgi:phosphatidylinositol alpha-1,6-mannosyltransferase